MNLEIHKPELVQLEKALDALDERAAAVGAPPRVRLKVRTLCSDGVAARSTTRNRSPHFTSASSASRKRDASRGFERVADADTAARLYRALDFLHFAAISDTRIVSA